MKARHVYATEDKNLRIVCRVNGQLCGDVLSAVPAVGSELAIELTIHDDDEPAASYEIDVFSDQVGGDPARDPIDTVTTAGNTIVPLRIEDIRYDEWARIAQQKISRSPLNKSKRLARTYLARRNYYDHIQHSLVGGFYQGWDLHPAQLPTRYAAVYSFFLQSLDAASERLRNFVEKAAKATLVGDVFDERPPARAC